MQKVVMLSQTRSNKLGCFTNNKKIANGLKQQPNLAPKLL